ncbi:acetyltransferase [Geitlerinema sp. CS-897]|nr:acetyltransferase [Geitlerinema sp. CS-897]
MSKQLYVLGAGGHGRVVLDTLLASGVQVTGILDPNICSKDRIFGVPILGGDEYLDSLCPKDILLVNGLGANPKTCIRKNIFNRIKSEGFSFASLCHPSATISHASRIGEGSQVMAGVVIQCEVILESNVVINTRASIDHNCLIKSHAFIAPGVTLCGSVVVLESAFIGAGAIVIPDIKIGHNTIVGAGSVVTKPVADGWIVAGNPAYQVGFNNI